MTPDHIAMAERWAAAYAASKEMHTWADVPWPETWTVGPSEITLDLFAIADPDGKCVIFRLAPDVIEIQDHRPARRWEMAELSGQA